MTDQTTSPACVWRCNSCHQCHENACPALWAVSLIPARCGHSAEGATR